MARHSLTLIALISMVQFAMPAQAQQYWGASSTATEDSSNGVLGNLLGGSASIYSNAIGGSGSGGSAGGASGPSTFNDSFSFTVPSGSSQSVSANLSFSTLAGVSNVQGQLLGGSGQTVSFTNGAGANSIKMNPLTLGPGTYTLQVTGMLATGSISYSSALQLSPALIGAVPEAGTMGMMLAGMAGLVLAVGRRRRARD